MTVLAAKSPFNVDKLTSRLDSILLKYTTVQKVFSKEMKTFIKQRCI